MSSRKRKHVSRKRENNNLPNQTKDTINPALFIQALEADIIRGPRGHAAALSLEIREVEGEIDVGSGLIRLGEEYTPAAFPEDDFENDNKGEGPSQPIIWVDRYDARLLLDSHTFSSPENRDLVASAPDSPTGWSDLPSDAEETYFFTAEETEDFRREKRRRLMEQTREERLKARMEEDGEQGEEIWGGSDEEPEESQKEIMRRTAKSLLVSPNPAQLEMRILANHGADVRFAFLRGRWSRAWKIVKARVRADKAEEEQQKAAPKAETPGMGLVADYGDSDDEDDETGIEPEQKEEQEQGNVPSEDTEEMEAAKELRRARAREWMANRKLTASK